MDPTIEEVGPFFPGNHWPIAITVRDNDTGNPYNLTGATIEAGIAGSPGWSGTPAVVNAAQGQIEVQVLSADTVNFSPGAYLGDVLVTSGGVPRTAVQFWVIVKRAVSTP